MAEHKIDKKLLETPVEYLCGDPDVRKGAGTEQEAYGLPAAEGVSANGGIVFNNYRTDVTPNKSQDEPSDSKEFKGNLE